MKAFARWIKALPDNQGEEEFYFRKNTVLQFGNSWDIIGAAILINPGSAYPNQEVIDKGTISKLQEISNTFSDPGEWREFNVDSTMRFLEKIFSGWYIGRRKRLNGVILLYNIFNIRCPDLEEALKLRNDSRLKDMPDMITKRAELTTLDVPIYIGWGQTGKSELAQEAKKIFDNVHDRVCYYIGEDFNNALFYHPLFVNTSYRKDATKRLLCKFLHVEGDVNPLIKINETVGKNIIENIRSYIDKAKIVESTPSKLSFRLCDDILTMAIVAQKTKQYIILQHSDYDKRRNYRNYSTAYKSVAEICDLIGPYGYSTTLDSSLGEKALNDFAATSVEEISNMILEEIQEIEGKVDSLLTKED